MKKYFLIIGFYLVSINIQAQTDRYWKGYGSSDNISDASNWFSVNPSSGDNLYFNNTGGDCGNTGRRNAYSNYAGGSFFGNLIVYNCAKVIKFYGDNSYFLKIENNSSPDLLEVANGTIGSRSGNNIEINPVGTGGLLISGTTLTIDNTTSSKSILIYGTQSLTINSAIGDVSGTGGQIQLLNTSTVTLGGTANNTYSGNTTTYNGGGLLILNKSAGIKAIGNNLIISNGSTVRTDADNQFGTGTPALVTINGSGIFNGNGKTQKIALASSSSTSSVTMGAGALVIDNTGTDTYDGIISGTGATLTKSNTGTQTLRGANTYTGLTTISGGTLQLNRTGGTTIPVTNNVTISAGTLRISSNQTLNTLVNNGTVMIDPGVTLTVGSITGSGTVTGSATSSLVITGTGSTLNFSQTSAATRSLNNLTLNSGSSATLGSALDVYGTIALTSASLNINTQNLTLKSNTSGTARIADLTGSSITNATNVTVERWIPLRGNSATGGRAYRLLAPTVNTSGSIQANWMETGINTAIGTNVNPVANFGTQISGTGGNANGFDVTQTNAPSLYLTTNATTPTYTAIGNTTQSLNALTGYFLYIRGDRSVSMQVPLGTNMPTTSTTLRTTGSLVTGPVSSFANGFVGGGALNLVTNPYPSPIDWSLLQPACTNVGTAYTLWDPNVGSRGGFVTVTTGGTVSGGGTATKFIQPGQAFFVQASGGVPAVNMQESHKTAGNNNTVFLVPPQSFQTSLYFTEDSGYRRMADGVNVLYDDVYSSDVDGNDATEINNWDENIAINRQSKHLAIESRPVITTRDTIPLFMNNMKQRNYEFEFTPASFTHIGLKAELVDNYLNRRTLLGVVDTSRVFFTVTADPASAASNRFMVVFGPQSPLAIDVLTISAKAKTNGVAIAWTANTESNMDRYEVERGNDGLSFTKINTSTAMGNSPTTVTYNWLDKDPITGDNFYRIKAIDKAGAVKYTDVVKVAFIKTGPSFIVSPNPVTGSSIRLRLHNMIKGIYQVSIVNNAGQKIYSEQLQYDGTSSSITIKTGVLAKGSYNFVLTGDNLQSSQQLIKN